MAVKHDIIPTDGADVSEEFWINGRDFFGGIFEELGHLPSLPIDDGRRDERKTAT